MKDLTQNRISNGIEARIHSHPWQALVHILRPKSSTLCGGALVHYKQANASDLILTAAHCLVDWERYRKQKTSWEKMRRLLGRLFKRYDRAPLVKATNVTVYLGLHDFTRPNVMSEKIRVAALEAGRFDNSTVTDDIALIKLEEKVLYNVAVQGICLPAENEGLPAPENPCLVAGWGLLRNGRTGTKLQQFQTYIIADKVNNPYFNENRMICSAMKELSVVKIEVADYNTTSHAQDIALLKLNREIVYDDFIQGICLPDENEELLGSESICVVTGWGRLANGRNPAALQELQVNIINGEVKSPFFQKRHMVCTGHDEIDTGARKGDSGGPLACLKNDTFVLYGVVSFGFVEDCSGLRERQAFTKVSFYLPWIRGTIAKLTPKNENYRTQSRSTAQ
ncbi:Polyprotein, serine proteases and ovochymase regi ons [Trichuris trichiura]|uniref:Polyprotein, serine proteases and ovochymase regi ons n=1 Tax=Trichuris trichiura TaxID=36087 RepID=A0A077Z888_TRITR|nr:Polyprotein, serine proteases and ovochymase regi ons [Trichuris trichiura]